MEYTEEYVQRKIAEFINLKNKCQRYWRRLLKESLIIIKQKGLKLETIDLENPNNGVLSPSGSKTIPIYKEGTEMNDEILLKYAKDKFPGLYHKFQRYSAKFNGLKEEMIEIRDYFKD